VSRPAPRSRRVRAGLAAPSGLTPARKVSAASVTTTRSPRVPLLSTLPPSGTQRATGGSKQRRPAEAIPRPRTRVPRSTVAQAGVGPQSTLLDLVDNLLNRGVLLTGEAVLGVAHVDLIYLRLTALLAAADRIFPTERSRRGAT